MAQWGRCCIKVVSPISACFDELNVTNPQQVARIHQRFIDAGSNLIETNTFGANRYKLAEYGFENRVAELNRAGVQLAQAVVASSDHDVYIAGSMGPLGRAPQAVWADYARGSADRVQGASQRPG